MRQLELNRLYTVVDHIGTMSKEQMTKSEGEGSLTYEQMLAANEQLIEKYGEDYRDTIGGKYTPMQMERTAMLVRFSRNWDTHYQMRERTLLTVQPLVESSLGWKRTMASL